MSHAPLRKLVADLDRDALVAEVARQLDQSPWKLERQRHGVTVYSCRELPSPFTGFRTVTEPRATVDEVARYLGPGLLDAMAEMNHLYLDGSVFRVLAVGAGAGSSVGQSSSDWSSVVRTAFRMPWPLADREFVHLLEERRVAPGVAIVAYHSVDDPDLPGVAPGFVRCPIYPSGQRITDLGDGRVRVEHLMVYDLAGRVTARGPWLQNSVFHRGHVSAYLKEWRVLVERYPAAAAAAAAEAPAAPAATEAPAAPAATEAPAAPAAPLAW